MTSLRGLVEKLEPGHYLAWQSENAKPVDRTRPKTVQRVDDRGDVIKVEATGQGDGEYCFTVDAAGNSEAYYQTPSREDPKPLGPIVFAELTNSKELVTVKRGYHDSRGEHNASG